MHPLFPLTAAVIPALFISRYHEFLEKHSDHFVQIVIFLLTAVYIWRMLIVFPDAPMEYRENNLLKMLLKIF